MPTYYDSSFLLAPLLGQAPGDALARLWDQETARVSSVILEAECVTALRRAAATMPRAAATRFLRRALDTLDLFLASISLRQVDGPVIQILRDEPRLGGCRSLDAIHLATALLAQTQSDEPLRICSLDRAQRKLAATLGFRVVGGT